MDDDTFFEGEDSDIDTYLSLMLNNSGIFSKIELGINEELIRRHTRAFEKKPVYPQQFENICNFTGFYTDLGFFQYFDG